MKLESKNILVQGSRSIVVVTTKYGSTLHVQNEDRISFSAPIFSNQIQNIKTRPFSTNGINRNLKLQAR